jgi:hypothetical protein
VFFFCVGGWVHSVSEAVEAMVRQYTMAFNLYHLNYLDEARATYGRRCARHARRTDADGRGAVPMCVFVSVGVGVFGGERGPGGDEGWRCSGRARSGATIWRRRTCTSLLRRR